MIRDTILPGLLAVTMCYPTKVAWTQVTPNEETSAAELKKAQTSTEELADGWHPKLGLDTTAAYNHSQGVVGTIDGTTVQLGLIVAGEASYVRLRHTWRNVLKLQEIQSRTPQIDGFLKSADTLDFKSTYLYGLEAAPWIGPYLQGSLNAQVLRGYDVHETAVVIVRSHTDGREVTRDVPAQRRVSLTRPFEPLLLREGVGAFARPRSFGPKTRLLAKVGAAMQQIIAREGFAVADDSATPQIEHTQLRDSALAGAELELQGAGSLSERVTWEASATFFFPFYTSVKTDLEGLDALNTDLSAKVSVGLSAWAALDYVLTAKRIPLVVDAWQVQNGVMLKASYDLL